MTKFIGIRFYLIIAILCLFLACLSVNYDYDLFARLIVGERFVEQGILPFRDFLSYTPTNVWYDHEWGSGVVFYLLLKYFGAFGLLLFQAVMLFFTSFFVIKTQQLQKHAFPPSLLFMGVFLALFSKLNSELIRCQLFSFLFFSIFLYILEGIRSNKFCKKKQYLIWALPVIIPFWNNLHGGVVSGLGLIAIYMIGALFEKKSWKKYFVVMTISGLMLIINPYGIKYLNFLFSAATKNRKYIVEWWPFYKKRHILYYIDSSLYGIFGFLSWIRKPKYVVGNITKLMVLVTTLYLGLAHVKLLSLTVIATASLCYNDMLTIFTRYKTFFKKVEKCLYAAIFVIALSIPLYSPFVPRANTNKFPLQEIEFLKINNIKGNIVTPFGLGSYTSYKLYPDNLIFMDGRYEEVYSDKIFNVLRSYELLNPNWSDIIDKYPTDILMPRTESEIYNFLKNDSSWSFIYDGKVCGIFVKKGTEKKSYKNPSDDIDYYRNTMFEHGGFTND